MREREKKQRLNRDLEGKQKEKQPLNRELAGEQKEREPFNLHQVVKQQDKQTFNLDLVRKPHEKQPFKPDPLVAYTHLPLLTTRLVFISVVAPPFIKNISCPCRPKGPQRLGLWFLYSSSASASNHIIMFCDL